MLHIDDELRNAFFFFFKFYHLFDLLYHPVYIHLHEFKLGQKSESFRIVSFIHIE